MPPSTPQDRKTSTKKTTSSRARKTTTARSPQPEPQQPPAPGEKYAASTWGSIGGMEDLEVPSGQLCLVKRPGVQGLIQAGVLHKIDSLTSLVQSKHINRVNPTPGGATEGINVASLMEDPKALDDIMHTVDRVVCHVVVQPPVHMTPNDVTNRKPGVIYADMVDLIDKMFIFNYVVGGSSDLETFRSGLDQSLGGVEA